MAITDSVSTIYKQLMQLNIKKPNNSVKKWVEDLNRHFSKDNTQMTIKHMKRCWKLLVIKEMQIHTARRHHLTPVRMAIIQKSTKNKCWRGCGEKGTLFHCRWECKLIQTLWRIVWRFLKKLKIKLAYDPAILFLCIYPEKTIIQRRIHFFLFNFVFIWVFTKLIVIVGRNVNWYSHYGKQYGVSLKD